MVDLWWPLYDSRGTARLTIFDFYLGLGKDCLATELCTVCDRSLWGKSRYVWPDKLGFIFG